MNMVSRGQVALLVTLLVMVVMPLMDAYHSSDHDFAAHLDSDYDNDYDYSAPPPTPTTTTTTTDSCGCGEVYSGSCGFLQKETNCWGEVIFIGKVCCASSEGGCCEADMKLIIGVVIGLVVFLALIIFASCACCSCCPCNASLRKCCCAQKKQQVMAVGYASG